MNSHFSLILSSTLGLLGATGLSAAVFQNSETLSSGNGIDDSPSAGLSRTLTITSPITVITQLTISLDIGSATGNTAWNGDLYVQLTSPQGTEVVLINRPGVSPTDNTGYGDAGYFCTINSSPGSTQDIHTYQSSVGYPFSINGSGQIFGAFQSDGRVDPTSGSRTKTLDNLFGENPNGTWTLLVADLDSGHLAKINGWGINGSDPQSVPEPAATALCTALTLLAAGVALRSHRERGSRCAFFRQSDRSEPSSHD